MEKILCITNDFGPRAGGIETFVIGLIERLPFGSVIVYTSAQEESAPYDLKWDVITTNFLLPMLVASAS